MRWLAACLIAALSVSCSRPSPPRKVAVAEPPKDESQRFPDEGRVRMELVPDHLLGYAFLPGGNLATYHTGKLDYQQFLGRMPDAESVPGVLVEFHKALKDAQYLAHMGGYFGTDSSGRPLYVFAKGAWVAGVSGLPQEQADTVARRFALHF